jgi:hypothetical protein
MGPDDPFNAPDRKPTSQQTQPGELLFEFVRESDHAHFRCELRAHGEWGVEAQFWMNGELLIARRFDSRALAVQWAVVERQAIEKGDE